MHRPFWVLLSFLDLARSAFDSENSLKVLLPGSRLFWPVDSANRTQENIVRNVAYARRMGGRSCCDVMLAHYEGSADDWDKDWYKNEVTSSFHKTGYKFKFLQEAYREDWQQKYEFVWALDSDIDFTGVNLVEMFDLARSSGSLIIGPTFSGDQAWKTYATDFMTRKALLRNDGKEGLQNDGKEDHEINVLGKPDPRCMMRHTDFVEMTAPLLSSLVLPLILKDCTDCIHDNAEWGLDRVWCSMASERFSVSACSLLDATPVRHLDWQTAKVTPAFKDAEKKVRARHAKYWAQVRNLDCMLAHEQRRVTIDGHGNIEK